MKDQKLRDLLERGGVIFQEGHGHVQDGCRDFSRLWNIALDNERKLNLLLDHLGLRFSYVDFQIKEKKECKCSSTP